MLNDPGYIALILIFVFWAILIALALLVGFRPKKWRQKPSGKTTGELRRKKLRIP